MSKETVGEYLKKERELRQISIKEVADGTKISISRLRLIEENKFDDLPAEVFVRGFIRNYAEYIGIDPEEAILRLEEDMKGQAASIVRQPEMVSATTIDVRSQDPRRFIGWIIAVIIILLVAAGVYYFFFTGKNKTAIMSSFGSNSTSGSSEKVQTGSNGSIDINSIGEAPKILLEEETNTTTTNGSSTLNLSSGKETQKN